jgi:hypothetical protein
MNLFSRRNNCIFTESKDQWTFVVLILLLTSKNIITSLRIYHIHLVQITASLQSLKHEEPLRINNVEDISYLFQVFFYSWHISAPVWCEFATVQPAAEQRSCHECIQWWKVGVIPTPATRQLCHHHYTTCMAQHHDSRRSVQLPMVGGKSGPWEVWIGTLHPVLSMHSVSVHWLFHLSECSPLDPVLS